jgi:hypothetical protein
MKSAIATFVFVNFLVSATADIVLNDMANHYNLLPSLKPYFREKSILYAALLAGLTIVSATLLLLPLSKLLFGFYTPTTFKQLSLFLALSYPLGFIIDKVIEKMEIFGPTLIPFYKKYGSGHWGAIAFVFSLFISFLLQKYLIPIL